MSNRSKQNQPHLEVLHVLFRFSMGCLLPFDGLYTSIFSYAPVFLYNGRPFLYCVLHLKLNEQSSHKHNKYSNFCCDAAALVPQCHVPPIATHQIAWSKYNIQIHQLNQSQRENEGNVERIIEYKRASQQQRARDGKRAREEESERARKRIAHDREGTRAKSDVNNKAVHCFNSM